jgi:hypothetical protein
MAIPYGTWQVSTFISRSTTLPPPKKGKIAVNVIWGKIKGGGTEKEMKVQGK